MLTQRRIDQFMAAAILAMIVLPICIYFDMRVVGWDPAELTFVFALKYGFGPYLQAAAAGLVVAAFALAQASMALSGRRSRAPLRYRPIEILLLLAPPAAALASGVVESMIYAGYFVVFYVSLRLFFQAPEHHRLRTYRLAAFALVGLLFYFYVFEASVSHRFIGPIHPNIAGGVAVFAAFCALPLERREKWVVLALAMAVAALAESRFAILSIVLMAMVYEMVVAERGRLLAAYLAAVLLAIVEISAGFPVLDSVFLVSDPYRGFGTGVAGRDLAWATFWPEVSMFEPKGFKNRDAYSGTHSGLLNTLIEFGLLLGFLFLGLVAARAAALIYAGVRTGWRDKFVRQAVAALSPLLIIGMFQPQIVSFGDAIGLLFVFIVATTPQPSA